MSLILDPGVLRKGSLCEFQSSVATRAPGDRAVLPWRDQWLAATKDGVDAVATSVNPKVIDCPNPEKGSPFLDAVAKDGIRLLIKARVTVRTNLEQLVGGATEDTIIARVGQGIVSAVGSMTSYKNVLENPDSWNASFLEIFIPVLAASFVGFDFLFTLGIFGLVTLWRRGLIQRPGIGWWSTEPIVQW